MRVNFNYFISETEFDFIVQAVHMVANHGWKLLPHYEFCPQTGQWRHHKSNPEPCMRLTDLSYRGSRLAYRSHHASEPEWALASYLADVRRIIEAVVEDLRDQRAPADPPLSDDFEALRWFVLPGEIMDEITTASSPTTPERRDAPHKTAPGVSVPGMQQAAARRRDVAGELTGWENQ